MIPPSPITMRSSISTSLNSFGLQKEFRDTRRRVLDYNYSQLRSECKRHDIKIIGKKEKLQQLLLKKLVEEPMNKLQTAAEKFQSAVKECKKKVNDDFPFQLKKFHAVAIWNFDVMDSVCAICRLDFAEPCVSCGVKNERNSVCSGKAESMCRIEVSSRCTHMFHQCCIRSWLEKSDHCPMCHTLWKFKGYLDHRG